MTWRKNSRKVCCVLLPLFVVAISNSLYSQVFEITRSTIDGGGTIRATGGPFELSGSIGQPDAGTASGGPFQMTGGFWIEISPTDCDEDGLVSLVDYAQFESCLEGPSLGPPTQPCNCFDIDRSGTVDLRDFAILQGFFTGP